MSEMDEYLRCTETIDCDSGAIIERARSLTEGMQTDREKAVALYYFVRDEIRHNPYAPLHDRDRYRASATLEAGNGFCQLKSILLVALCRALGIPARLGFVDVRDHLLSDKFKEMIGGVNVFPHHGYAELFIQGRWIHVSPAYDLATCGKNRFVPVEFDGMNDARDSRFDEDGRPHMEHVEDHGPYADLPWEDMQAHYKKWVAQLGLDWDELKETGERVRQGRSWGERE